MSPVRLSDGHVYPTVEEFFAEFWPNPSPALLRYRRRYERVSRKFWERGGRRKTLRSEEHAAIR